jgi:hypothetical protein
VHAILPVYLLLKCCIVAKCGVKHLFSVEKSYACKATALFMRKIQLLVVAPFMAL